MNLKALLLLFVLALPLRAEQAEVIVHPDRSSGPPISKYLTGKFCEHLGSNIYQGMDAQILRNPTMADWPFWTGQMNLDGRAVFHWERDKIAAALRQQAKKIGFPDDQLAPLVAAREANFATWWVPHGHVMASPDTGPAGGRAQRLEIHLPAGGVAQACWLPRHRTGEYQFAIHARSPDLKSLTIALWGKKEAGPLAGTEIQGLTARWSTLKGTLRIDRFAKPTDEMNALSVTSDKPGTVVVASVQLWPADHVGGADPDVVRLLRESRLPLLRWPGGNFVSAYHWEDGVGPAELRPTRPNYAWGAVEPNLFGTDEFLAFCRAVGCEPMICVNAGDGTPAEAARWVEYCNGPADSPQGKRRAANGHPEPYGVHHWEIGNELWGRWQCHWTTPLGYVDRLRQFAKAMHAADPSIRLYACGAPVLWGKDWNDALIAGLPAEVQTTTDHPLIGGTVKANVDPLDVFRDFMVVPDLLETRWAALRKQMEAANVPAPRLAITELQMFARAGEGGTDARLTRENLVAPRTQAEALYDVLFYHRAVRLAPFFDVLTHSATVNHGGGLRKDREVVFADPCHFAQSTWAELAGATPLTAEVSAPREKAPAVLPELQGKSPPADYSVLDALAARAADGTLLISLVHRGTAGPLKTIIRCEGMKGTVEVRTLAAEVPWAANSREAPDRIHPVDTTAVAADGKLELLIPRYAVVRLRVRKS